MKTWALGAMMVGVMALVACGGSSTGNTGGGGSGTTSTTVSTTHSTTVTTSSTSTGGDPCADGSDCSACADFNTCYDCDKANHPEGEQLFNAFIECVICEACYTSCDGATSGCPMAPPTKDACDMASMPDMTACGDSTMGCIKCAQGTGATCEPAVNACKASNDCIAFNSALQADCKGKN
jgi:hypothetical protein